MSTIVVKNFPEELHDRLRERAERNRRSMTKEVIHLIASGLGSDTMEAGPPHTSVGSEAVRDDRAASLGSVMAGGAPGDDGRAALRAALVRQPDGSYVNVLGIEDADFFDTLDRIRAEAAPPDVDGLFDDTP